MILPKHSVNCDCPLNKKKLLYSLFLLELSTPKVVVTQLCKHNRFHLISCARKKNTTLATVKPLHCLSQYAVQVYLMKAPRSEYVLE